MHVPDWDPAMLAKFNAQTFAENLKRSGAQSHLQMCNSHAGYAMWQTKLGIPHKNMGGRDFIAELSAACRKRDLRFIAYFSLGFDCLMHEKHPDWRVRHLMQRWLLDRGRVGLCCYNSPGYEAYVLGCIDELADGRYPIDGMFFDMTFWMTPCYCPHCTEKFRNESGHEPPVVVNFDDPVWRAWQKFRERTLLDFALGVTARVKSHDPDYTVSHNHSTALSNWILAAPLEITRACDYESGDFYGEPVVHSLACKVYRSLSRSPRFELATSRTRGFWDHVTVKSMDELKVEAFIATLHSAALLLIDYVNMDGTLNNAVYDFLKPLNDERAAYEPFLGGDLVADVALYLDKNSLYDPASGGTDIWSLPRKFEDTDPSPHRTCFTGAAKLLQRSHIPFGVVTNATIDQLARYRTVVLPEVLDVTPEQAELFRRFVREGGTLYASARTSLDRPANKFVLGDLFGVEFTGPRGSGVNYITPADESLRKALWPQDHVSHAETMQGTKLLPGTEVLAWQTETFVDPALGDRIGQRFGSFHANPPALAPSKVPAITLHRYGKGRVIWTAVAIEQVAEETNRRLFAWIMEQLRTSVPAFELDGPQSVEMTVHDQPDNKRLIAGLINLGLPPGLTASPRVRLRHPAGKKIRRLLLAPDLEPVAFEDKGDMIEFDAAPFECFRLYLAEYE